MVRIFPCLPDVGLHLARSFYPLFPSPLELSHEVNLDISHLEYVGLCHEEGAYAPDVLIVPSRLKHFSKVRPVFQMASTISQLHFTFQDRGSHNGDKPIFCL